MRIRTLLPTLLLAVGGLLVLASPASAQEGQGEPQLSEDTEECIHLAEEADDPDACQEAPNPILPATDELVWGSISFAALLFLLYKFAYPQIRQMLENRTERIRSDLQAAETAKGEAEQILAEYRAQLNDARAEAGRIIEEARQAADRSSATRRPASRPSWARCGPAPWPTSNRPRPKRCPTCEASWHSSPSAPPRPWSSTTWTRPPRPS